LSGLIGFKLSSSGFADFARLDALGANPFGDASTVFFYMDRLQVRQLTHARFVVRMGDAVSRFRALATDFTLSGHDILLVVPLIFGWPRSTGAKQVPRNSTSSNGNQAKIDNPDFMNGGWPVPNLK
jgi:hypothetical protein